MSSFSDEINYLIMLAVLCIMLLVMVPILIPAIKRQFKRPEFTDADMFQDFVTNDLFTHLDIVVPTNVAVKKPHQNDLQFLDPVTGFQVYVKCYYCAAIKNGEFIWCTEQQLKNFQTSTALPLFVIFGIGGPSHFPDNLYQVPFDKLNSNKTKLSSLEKYRIKIGQPFDISI